MLEFYLSFTSVLLTTTIAPAETGNSTHTRVHPVTPKFGLFQFTEPVGPTQVLHASATAIKIFM